MPDETLDGSYFADVYARNDDPWDFATSAYEREKYDATIAALGERRFARALEIGCSIGVLTARLSTLCDEVVALDIAERALAAARERCAGLANVRFAHAFFPSDMIAGPYDLVVVSEVAYYWSDADFARARDRIAAAAPGGLVELVHFTPHVPDYVRSGDAVHEAFLADARFEHRSGSRAERYRLDVFVVR